MNLRFRPELIAPSVYIAQGAVIIGDVTIGDDSSVWFNSVIRGESDSIRIGSRTNIQDLCLLHADPGVPCVIGNQVTIGHSAIVHGATVEDDVLIGMGSIIMNGARIGARTIIAAGSIVTQGTHIPPGSIVMGSPANVRRHVEEFDMEKIRRSAANYVERAREFRAAS